MEQFKPVPVDWPGPKQHIFPSLLYTDFPILLSSLCKNPLIAFIQFLLFTNIYLNLKHRDGPRTRGSSSTDVRVLTFPVSPRCIKPPPPPRGWVSPITTLITPPLNLSSSLLWVTAVTTLHQLQTRDPWAKPPQTTTRLKNNQKKIGRTLGRTSDSLSLFFFFYF